MTSFAKYGTHRHEEYVDRHFHDGSAESMTFYRCVFRHCRFYRQKFLSSTFNHCFFDRCIFTYASFQDADFHRSRFRNICWQSSTLTGAYILDSIGILRLPVGDPRGYEALAFWHSESCGGSHWRIFAGCRFFDLAEAEAHWRDRQVDTSTVAHLVAPNYLHAIDWLRTSRLALDAAAKAAADFGTAPTT